VTARSQLPLKALLAFEVFARTGRMTLAAHELCVSYGAISKMSRELQNTLGVKLVEGQRSNLRINAAGARLAASLTAGFDQIARGVSDLRVSSQVQLKISCLGTFAMRWLIPRLPHFYSRHPSIAINLRESHAPVDLVRDGDDAAIRMFDGQSMISGSTAFLQEYSGPVMAPSLGSEIKTHNDQVAAIQALPRLSTRTWPEGWRRWEMLVSAKHQMPSSLTEFDHTFYMLAAAAAGLGVAIGSWALVEREIKEGSLIAPLGFETTNTHYVLLQNPQMQSAALKAFADWLVDEGKTTNEPPFSAQQKGGPISEPPLYL
jgi:LysR family glycine cleavage system transcriptional activator